jgi:hypothetical protein
MRLAGNGSDFPMNPRPGASTHPFAPGVYEPGPSHCDFLIPRNCTQA